MMEESVFVGKRFSRPPYGIKNPERSEAIHMWPFYVFMTMLLTTFLYGVELDVAHTLKTKTVLQAGMDAATLAGALQNHVEVSGKDPYGAPISYGYVLNYDSGPENAAVSTWYKNVYNWNAGIGLGAAANFARTPENKGISGNVTQNIPSVVSTHVMEAWFGQGSAPDSTVPVPASSVSKLPY